MDELDASPTIDEFSKAIGSQASSKAVGSDNIPPEVVKLAKDSFLLEHLCELLLQCWDNGAGPKNMRDAKIITAFKDKG